MTIVVSIQAVGIILVVAMLTTPAATAQLLTARFGRLMAIAIVIGIASGIAGIYVSFLAQPGVGCVDRADPDCRLPRGSRARATRRPAPSTSRGADRRTLTRRRQPGPGDARSVTRSKGSPAESRARRGRPRRSRDDGRPAAVEMQRRPPDRAARPQEGVARVTMHGTRRVARRVVKPAGDADGRGNVGALESAVRLPARSTGMADV